MLLCGINGIHGKKTPFSVNDGNSVQYGAVQLSVAQQSEKVLKFTAWMIPLMGPQAQLLWQCDPR